MTLLTVAQYAEQKGVSRQTVHWYIKHQKVTARRVGHIWLIETQDSSEN